MPSLHEAILSGGAKPDPNDDELGRPYRRDANRYDEPPIVDVRLSHRGAIAFHEKCLLRFSSQQSAIAPLVVQKILRVACDGLP